MMTHCYIIIYKFIYFSFYEFTREGDSKITLTFSYNFNIGRPERFHKKTSDSKVQRECSNRKRPVADLSSCALCD